MSRPPVLHTLVLALALCCTAEAHAADDISKINGSIEVAADTSHGKLETVNGAIQIGAQARVKDVETVNGGIVVVTAPRPGIWKPSTAASASAAP